jgi:serine/threonine protein phosphatase 1
VGDIHGRADLLAQLHEAILADAGTGSARENILVYLGDYVDRGAFVRETIDELHRADLPGFRREYLMGNHEQLLLGFLEDPGILDYWLTLGGRATLLSYGINLPFAGTSGDRARDLQEEFRRKLPDRHLAFYENLKAHVRIGDYLFVHAGIRPGVDLDNQNREDFYWIRDEFLNSVADHRFKVVHGHTISAEVENRSNRLGVDTGAYATGVLTCTVLEEEQTRFLAT